MFKSKKEFIIALIEGRKFYTTEGITIHYDDSMSNPFRVGKYPLTAGEYWRTFSTVTEVLNPTQQLQETLKHKPVLCKVWNKPHNNKLVALVTGYNASCCYLTSTGSEWLNARPLTKAEAEFYILELT